MPSVGSVSMRTKDAIIAAITEIGIVPAMRPDNEYAALKCVEAIYRGGIRAAEIIVTTPGAIARSRR